MCHLTVLFQAFTDISRTTARDITKSAMASRPPNWFQTSSSWSLLTSCIFTYVSLDFLYECLFYVIVNVPFQPVATTFVGFVLLAINSLVALLLIVLIVLRLGEIHRTQTHFNDILIHITNPGWGTIWYRKQHLEFLKRSGLRGAPTYNYHAIADKETW